MDVTPDSKASARSGECLGNYGERYLSIRQVSRNLAAPL